MSILLKQGEHCMTSLHNLVLTFALSTLAGVGGIGCIAPASAADDTTDVALDDESSILGDEATNQASQALDLGCGQPEYPPAEIPAPPPPDFGGPEPVPVPVAAPVPVGGPVPVPVPVAAPVPVVPGCVIPLPVLVPTPFAVPIAIPAPVLVPVPLPIPTYVVTPVPFPVPFLTPVPVPVGIPVAVPAPCGPGIFGFGC
jgi:hypothetical protein